MHSDFHLQSDLLYIAHTKNRFKTFINTDTNSKLTVDLSKIICVTNKKMTNRKSGQIRRVTVVSTWPYTDKPLEGDVGSINP